MRPLIIPKMGTIFLIVSVMLIGCGPTTFTRVRFSQEPYSPSENKQTKEDITIEIKNLDSFPPEFIANIQKCDTTDGKLYVDSNGEPVMEKTIALPKSSTLQKISITNKTGHIVRLNSTVIAAFDPADNQYDTLSKQEIASYLMQERPCPNTQRLINQLNLVKIINRNTELLPNRTLTGYLVYKPHDPNLPGIWKLSFYEVPVETDAAGKVTKTVNFDFRRVVKKHIDTYKRDNMLATPVKISSELVE